MGDGEDVTNGNGHTRWQNRIVGEDMVDADQLLANPTNWRIHPKHQQAALTGVLDNVGWVQRVIVNQRTGHVIDGHLRASLAISRGEQVPVIYVDVDEDEERLILATLDPLAAMAATDAEMLEDLLRGLGDTPLVQDDEGLRELLGAIAGAAGIALAGGESTLTTEAARRTLAERFIVPPFSVLDARQGYWQTRKRAWIALGIQSELGRGARVFVKHDATDPVSLKILEQQDGQSIFDPVLCELAYRWFSPPAGAVLDPFAGGSVRGIVAARLGRRYVGIDLRTEQVEANRQQAEAILNTAPPGDTVTVKVSAKNARLPFNGCDPAYIRDVCHASCCQSSTSPTGTMITIHPSEQATIEARGGVVVDGLLQPRPGEKRCPFKTDEHLCGLHFTPDKPFGCIASPFTLNKNNTLIVRNRYRLLKCYDDGKKIPAYQAFRASLDLIFGTDEAARICEHLDSGGGDLMATMRREQYQMLVDNDAIKHGRGAEDDDAIMPRWIVGDSRDMDKHLRDGEAFDFVFTCPPYFDLEIYSDDPADLSNAGDYAEFMAVYRDIIAKSLARLRDDRFACIVVGDIRDKRGMYRNFVSDTIAAHQDAGATLYNEAILVTAVGSLPIRVGKQFEAGRKLGKTHQNVLVFVKGDPRKATEAVGSVEYGDIADGSTE